MITTDTHVYFYSATNCLSNWHHNPRQLQMNGMHFDSTEQAFMFCKARFFGDLDIAALAHQTTDPRQVKVLGRQVKGYDDSAWECVREGLMAYCCLLKFRQNPAMAAELLGTDERVLVEASPVDRIWGIGLDENSAASGLPWQGRNLLGEALMTVRRLLWAEQRAALTV